jgi:hypothetical protein
MKLLFAIVLAAFLSSCGGDDSAPQLEKSSEDVRERIATEATEAIRRPIEQAEHAAKMEQERIERMEEQLE